MDNCIFCENREKVGDNRVEFSLVGRSKSKGGKGVHFFCRNKQFHNGYALLINYCPICGKQLDNLKYVVVDDNFVEVK